MAWVFATMDLRDVNLFGALARAAARRLLEFDGQGATNTAWAFATVSCGDEKLFALLARVPERLLSEFIAQELANTA